MDNEHASTQRSELVPVQALAQKQGIPVFTLRRRLRAHGSPTWVDPIDNRARLVDPADVAALFEPHLAEPAGAKARVAEQSGHIGPRFLQKGAQTAWTVNARRHLTPMARAEAYPRTRPSWTLAVSGALAWTAQGLLYR